MISFPETLSLGSVLGLTLLIFLIGVITGIIEMMFQYFMQRNMILYPWAILLAKIASINEPLRHLMRPFGRCRFCNSIWICMYTYIYIIGFNPLILFAFAFNFMTVWLLTKYVFPLVEPSEDADEDLQIEHKYQYTPWQAMLKTYAIMGVGYAIIYGIIPLIV